MDEQDKKLFTISAKALNTLYYALNADEFKIICSYRNAKEIWHTLEVTHEGTSQVKESKLI